ncbi:MAG: DNA polymerase III subunit delta [Verrucomicrobia bacterium]|nr:DNA polymerase III subunit delta [Verrucomicrobiota bacterium]
MASDDATLKSPVALVCGDDDFSVKQRARQIFQQWCAEWPGLDHEIIDASVTQGGEALAALRKLREALQTLPFFGSGKVVWLQNCSFLGDERTANSQAVTEALGALARELKNFSWNGVRLLISAGKVDKRKTFYKTLEKLGPVENFAAWTMEDRNWSSEAENMVRLRMRALKKQVTHEAVGRLLALVGPNARQLHSEVEKLALYAGDRPVIQVEDVEAVVSRNKHSRAFALGDALGARDLPRLLRALDDELWEMQTDRQQSEIGLLYGLISKVRGMIFLREMLDEGWIKAESDYPRFKVQLERVPADAFPEDKRFNPLAMNPYVLFKAQEHARNYTQQELIRAMEILLQCNQRLVFSGLDEAMVLQQSVVQIVSRSAESPPHPQPR